MMLFVIADRNEKIWEFVKGRLRIYWFDAGDAVIVCVCGCVKKTQKVDPSMVKKAIQVKNEYLRLKGAGVNVEIVEEYLSAHLPFARSIPIEELRHGLEELPKDRPIVAYCTGPYCLMARDAVDLLNRQGFDAVHLEEGVAEWGLPAVHA